MIWVLPSSCQGDRSDLWNQNPKLLERKQQRNTNAEDANDGRFLGIKSNRFNDVVNGIISRCGIPNIFALVAKCGCGVNNLSNKNLQKV